MNSPIILSFLGGMPGGGEVLLIFVFVLLLFGAKNLPGIARSLGRALEEFRKSAREVTDELMHEEPKKQDPAKTLREDTDIEEPSDDSTE